MALSNIEKHYNKHPEDLRLQRRHGIVEFETTMYHLRRLLRPGMLLLDIGAGTGRYASALMAEGYKVKAVELVRRNIEVFRQRDPEADVVQGDARDLSFIPSASADATLLLGPLYHLIGEEEKLKALREARRVTKPGGLIFVAYLMNEYSILSYCFDEERIGDFLARGIVDHDFHIQTQEGELYDYVRLEDIDRLDRQAGLQRVTIFSPDGPADYMRTRLNRMSDETFAHFLAYQKVVSERPDLIGAGSHVVDVVRAGAPWRPPRSVGNNKNHTYNKITKMMMQQEPILNEHNKEEFPPAHTAEHLLNQLMIRLFGTQRSNNAHVERKKSKITYKLDHKPTRKEEKEIETEMNRLIALDMPVSYEFTDRDHLPEGVDADRLPANASEAIRLVRIGDYDVCPCIGKHVRSTAQIGRFELLGTNWNEEKREFRVRFKIVQ